MSVLAPLLNHRFYLGYIHSRGEHTSLKGIIANVHEMFGYNGYDIGYNIHANVLKIYKKKFVCTIFKY